ncbi:MAG: hypothetical protein H7A01_07225 [Hahellaceae bacterium]|nr:hypothetical protein [Hahellaceae bacterium]MCP5211695.1 hypothetical protein [Hahellaceae bacterium]
MIALRECLSTLIFIVGIFATVSLISESFSWGLLLGAMFCFVIAYLMWPSKKRGQRETEHWFLDIAEFVIELPVEIMLRILRFIGQLFKSKDGGFDLDL